MKNIYTWVGIAAIGVLSVLGKYSHDLYTITERLKPIIVEECPMLIQAKAMGGNVQYRIDREVGMVKTHPELSAWRKMVVSHAIVDTYDWCLYEYMGD